MENFEKKVYTKPEVKKQLKFQNRDPFEDFISNLEPNEERRKPTPQEVKSLNESLVKLSQLLGNTDIRWQLDGALNISIMKGDYIGVHKDIDISVEPADLKKLEKILLNNGYGFFVSYKIEESNPKSPQTMERVDAESIISRQEHPQIVAIDKDGKILKNTPLNYIDLHLIKRNQDGEAVGYGDVVFPEDWIKPIEANFQGKELKISHPARVAYFKLHSGRNYDKTDLFTLVDTKKLTASDIDEIDKLMDAELKLRNQRADEILDGILPDLNKNSTAKEIFLLLMKQPLLAAKGDSISKQVEILAQNIAELPAKTSEGLKTAFLKMSTIAEFHDEQKAFLKTLKNRALTKEIEK